MNSIIGAGLISGAGSLLSGIIGASASAAANRANIQLAREQMQWQEAMWNKQNEYNTPANQVSRLLAAGLSPNLAYGNLQSGNAGSISSYQRANVNPITTGEQFGSAFRVASDIMQLRKMKAEISNIEANTSKTKTDEANVQYETENILPARAADIWQAAEQKKWSIDYTKKQLQNYDELVALDKEFKSLTNKNLRQTYNNLTAQYATELARKENLDASTANTIAQTSLVPFQKQLIQSQTAKNVAEKSKILEEIKSVVLHNELFKDQMPAALMKSISEYNLSNEKAFQEAINSDYLKWEKDSGLAGKVVRLFREIFGS